MLYQMSYNNLNGFNYRAPDVVGAFGVDLSLPTKLFKCFGPPRGLPLTTSHSHRLEDYT